MHIIIGLLTAIAGLVWALNNLQRSGVDLNTFNPFTWARRRRWEKQLGTKPLHRIQNPMEAAALLVVAMARCEGDITRELKQSIIGRFGEEFKVNQQRAGELLAVSTHLLADVMSAAAEVRHILAPTRERFTPEQCSALLAMLRDIGSEESPLNEEQQAIIAEVEKQLRPEPQAPSSAW